MQIFIGIAACISAIQMVKLVLLRRNLNQQALAQVAAPTPAGSRCCTRSIARRIRSSASGRILPFASAFSIVVFCSLAQTPRPAPLRWWPGSRLHPDCRSQTRRLMQQRLESQRSQLPRQVIGQGRRLGEKVLKRGLFAVFILRLRAIAGIKIVLEIRSEIDLLERVLGRGRRAPRLPAGRSKLQPLQPLLVLRPATSSSIGTDSSISSRTGFSTISASIISFSSSLFSARTLTICIRPGVRTWRCDTFSVNLVAAAP
jgi:hypothetical protein